MRRTTTGQRPQLNQAHSSVWRWPRLVPIQEQHARASQENRPSARSSRAQSVHNEGEQAPSPTELAETSPTGNLSTKDAATQSPVLGAAGSASPVKEPCDGPTEVRNMSEAENTASPTNMKQISPTDHALPESPVSSVASCTSLVRDSDTGSTERRDSGEARGSSSAVGGSGTFPTEYRHSSQAEASSASVEHSFTGSTERRHSNEAEVTDVQVEDSGTEPAGRRYSSEIRGSVSTVSGLDIQPSAIEDDHMPNKENNKSIDDALNEAEQGTNTRRETTSSRKNAEVQSISDDEAPDAAEGAS